MSEPIKVGDLVQVIRGTGCSCDKAHSSLGLIFRVERMGLSSGQCHWCHAYVGCENAKAAKPADYGSFSLHRLKRIPPLSELEGVKTEEDTREPA